MGTSQRNMWQPLKDAYPDRVHLFVRKDQVFVHSKMLLIDDVWALVGSANIGYRSFTNDIELGAAIVDSEHVTSADGIVVTRFAHDVRVRSWSEVSGVPAHIIRKSTIPEAIGEMASAASAVEELTEMPRSYASAILKEA